MKLRLGETARQFLANASGNISIMFAASLLVILSAVGAAVDHGGALYGKTDADAAADAAILAAINTASQRFAEGEDDWEAAGKELGINTFKANLTTDMRIQFENVDVEIKRKDSGLEAKLRYSVGYPTSFMQIFGYDKIKLSNEVTGASGTPGYISIHFVIDVSGSMGIAATKADEAIINAVNGAVNPFWAGKGCGFACHVDEKGGVAPTREKVKQAGARIRLDIVTDALRQIIEDAKAKGFNQKQIEISMHTFSNSLMEIQAPTTNIDKALKAVGDIDLVNMPLQGGTNIRHALAELQATLPKAGDGSSVKKRKSYVVLLSDGVESSRQYVKTADHGVLDFRRDGAGKPLTVQDVNFLVEAFNYNGGLETVQAFNASSCTPLKKDGHVIYTAAVEYLIPDADIEKSILAFIKKDLVEADRLKKSFQACATEPENAFHAKKSSEIEPMFKTVLNKIFLSSSAVLTH